MALVLLFALVLGAGLFIGSVVGFPLLGLLVGLGAVAAFIAYFGSAE